ncbi:MAG: hypothetical protein NTZ97_05125 [Candidatus Moranbacteria bacterium]|nr:hypothetical protein [Candidatus Moranbacteria bacterium]
MSLCPVCGAYLCDHTPAEREQTLEEMNRPLTKEEFLAWHEAGGDPDRYNPDKIEVAKKYRYHIFTEKDREETREFYEP